MADRGNGKEKATKGGTKGPGGRRSRQAAQVAQVLLDRDDHVAGGLALLGELGVLDERTRERLWSLYQQGDQATRAFLQEQLARVVGDDPVEPGHKDPQAPRRASSVDPLELEVLKQLSSPHVDAAEVAQHVRRFDPARLLGASKEPGSFMRFLSDAPLAVHRVQKRLLWAGVSILVFVVALVATAVFVPAIVPWVGLGGVVLLALFIGVLLVRTAGWIDRSAKQQGIDLAVYAQLPEDERRVLLVRRVGLRILDPHRKEAGPSGDRDTPKSPSVDPPEPVPAESEPPVPQEATWPVQESAKTEPEQEAVPEGPVSLGPEPERPPEKFFEKPSEKPPEEPESHAAALTAESGRNGPSQEQPGRLARFVQGARNAWRQAAESETAHKVGSETKRVSQEAGKRAQQVGRSAHERFSELRERGEAGLEKHRQARSKKAPAKKRTVKASAGKKSPAKRTGKKSAKKSAKKASKRAPKRAGERGGNRAGKRGKKSGKKSSARKGTAKKGAVRSSRKRSTRQ